MDWEYWIDRSADLLLLVAGGGLTILGATLNNRALNRTRSEDRRLATVDAWESRNREALATLRDIVFQLYVDVRDQSRTGVNRAKIDQATLLSAESQSYLLQNDQLRESVDLALRAMRGLGVPVNHGLLEGTEIKIQAQTLHAILRVLAAEERGDALPSTPLELIRKVGEATRDAWQEENSPRETTGYS